MKLYDLMIPRGIAMVLCHLLCATRLHSYVCYSTLNRCWWSSSTHVLQHFASLLLVDSSHVLQHFALFLLIDSTHVLQHFASQLFVEFSDVHRSFSMVASRLMFEFICVLQHLASIDIYCWVILCVERFINCPSCSRAAAVISPTSPLF